MNLFENYSLDLTNKNNSVFIYLFIYLFKQFSI